MAKFHISVDIWRITGSGSDEEHDLDYIVSVDTFERFIEAKDIAEKIAKAYQPDTKADQD